jgi:hypothetical protein
MKLVVLVGRKESLRGSGVPRRKGYALSEWRE